MAPLCGGFSDAAQRLEPFVFLDAGVHVKTRTRAGDGVVLVSVTGAEHPLRRLATPRVWQEHTARLAAADVARDLRAALAAGAGRGFADVTADFLSDLVPSFERRDVGDDRPPGGLEADSIADVVRALPAPRLESPCLLVRGRLWALSEAVAPRGVHVRVGNTRWSPTGAFIGLGQARSAWQASVRDFVCSAARALASERTPPAPPSAEAGRELARTGAIERGDLVLLDSTPPRLGHVIPAHYNRSLGRESRRDLLLSAPYPRPDCAGLPGGLLVFERRSGGGWAPVATPHGVCLGSQVPTRPAGLGEPLALAAYLRWAAIRIGANGRFHEHDAR